MPKGAQQTRSDIIQQLQHRRRELITTNELLQVMADHGVNAPGPVRDYTKAFLAGNYLERTTAGYQLTKASKRTATIIVQVSPTQSYNEIVRAVTTATVRFGRTVTLEIEP